MLKNCLVFTPLNIKYDNDSTFPKEFISLKWKPFSYIFVHLKKSNIPPKQAKTSPVFSSTHSSSITLISPFKCQDTETIWIKLHSCQNTNKTLSAAQWTNLGLVDCCPISHISDRHCPELHTAHCWWCYRLIRPCRLGFHQAMIWAVSTKHFLTTNMARKSGWDTEERVSTVQPRTCMHFHTK